jgi:hypothetical protein
MKSRWGTRVIPLLLAATALIGSVGPSRAAAQPPALLFNFADARINESSGVASASYRDDLLFTHNDSGDTARFFAVNFAGQTEAVYTVANAAAVDWEDMARGPHSDGTPGQSLYLADIGNNFRDRAYLVVYEVSEPVVGVSGPVLPLRSARAFRYDDIRHDAETFMVNPNNGDLIVVAKEFHGLSNVYVLRGSRAVKVATILIPTLMTLSADAALTGTNPLPGTQITGGDIGPVGDRLVVRTYLEAFEWRLLGGNYKATFKAKPTKIALPKTVQGEAAGYTRDGTGFLVTSEGVGAPVHRISSSF